MSAEAKHYIQRLVRAYTQTRIYTQPVCLCMHFHARVLLLVFNFFDFVTVVWASQLVSACLMLA